LKRSDADWIAMLSLGAPRCRPATRPKVLQHASGQRRRRTGAVAVVCRPADARTALDAATGEAADGESEIARASRPTALLGEAG
jgi:hypothetical protein